MVVQRKRNYMYFCFSIIKVLGQLWPKITLSIFVHSFTVTSTPESCNELHVNDTHFSSI